MLYQLSYVPEGLVRIRTSYLHALLRAVLYQLSYKAKNGAGGWTRPIDLRLATLLCSELPRHESAYWGLLRLLTKQRER